MRDPAERLREILEAINGFKLGAVEGAQHLTKMTCCRFGSCTISKLLENRAARFPKTFDMTVPKYPGNGSSECGIFSCIIISRLILRLSGEPWRMTYLC